MKFNKIVCALATASLGFSTLASAADFDPRQDWYQRYQRDDHYAQQRERQKDFQSDRRNDRHNYYNARGPEFRRGARIPYEYRRSPYVVVNYRAYHLAPPPRGLHWVQVGPDYVLIAIATGVIASIILGH